MNKHIKVFTLTGNYNSIQFCMKIKLRSYFCIFPKMTEKTLIDKMNSHVLWH